MTKNERVVHVVGVEYEKEIKQSSENSHYEKHRQLTYIACKLLSIRKWGRACGAIEGEPSQTLFRNSFDFADTIEDRQ